MIGTTAISATIRLTLACDKNQNYDAVQKQQELLICLWVFVGDECQTAESSDHDSPGECRDGIIHHSLL